MRGVWIEIVVAPPERSDGESLPMRGVWIEIVSAYHIHDFYPVTPHAGSVD